MTLKLDIFQTMAIAVAVFYVGHHLRHKIPFLLKYCIPAPVIGGLLFALLTLILRVDDRLIIGLDTTLQPVFMTAFFTSIGFTSSLSTLKKGGPAVVIFLLIVTLLGLIQNGIGVGLAKAFDLNPLLGLSLGSVSLTGGHGTSGAFGPYLENLGAAGATTAAIAAATFGLVAGGLLGGPTAGRLIRKYNLKPTGADDGAGYSLDQPETQTAAQKPLNLADLMLGASLLFLSMGLGTLITAFFKMIGVTVPSYVGGMLIAALIRNIMDSRQKTLPVDDVAVLGGLCMNFFLALALMGLKLWELVDLAGPMVVILLAQTVVTVLFAYFITYRVMSRGYDGALFVTAHVGVGLGVTATAVANMDSVSEEHGMSMKPYFVVPLVGGLFLDFTNSLCITTFANFFK